MRAAVVSESTQYLLGQTILHDWLHCFTLQCSDFARAGARLSADAELFRTSELSCEHLGPIEDAGKVSNIIWALIGHSAGDLPVSRGNVGHCRMKFRCAVR